MPCAVDWCRNQRPKQSNWAIITRKEQKTRPTFTHMVGVVHSIIYPRKLCHWSLPWCLDAVDWCRNPRPKQSNWAILTRKEHKTTPTFIYMVVVTTIHFNLSFLAEIKLKTISRHLLLWIHQNGYSSIHTRAPKRCCIGSECNFHFWGLHFQEKKTKRLVQTSKFWRVIFSLAS